MRRFPMIVACIAIAVLSAAAHAQGYPAKPVKIIVAYPPGGVVDILARILAGPLQVALKQPIIVENKPGAGGSIGTSYVAKSAPDGYTLLLAAAGPLVSTKMMEAVPYDPVNDFTPIAMVGDTNVVLVASTALKPKSVAELIEHAKANPGKVNLAINVPGSMHHLLSELMMLRTGIKMTRVPYKGAAQVMPDLLSGTVDLDMESLPMVADYIRSNRMKAIAAASTKRLEMLPNVPTFTELGWPELVALPWYAFVGPAGMPKEIVARLNEDISKILRQPAIAAQIAKQGANVVIADPDETGKFVRSEIERWGKVVVETNTKMN